MTALNVGHGSSCLCSDCTAARLAATTRTVAEPPRSPFAEQRDHVMTMTVAPAVTSKRGTR